MSGDYYERMAARDRMERTLKTARTYLRKAESYLYPYRGEKGEIVAPPSPPSWLFWDLLDQSLQVALAIIEKLPDDFFEATDVEDILGLGVGGKHNSSDEPLERTQKVLAAIERRRGDANLRRKIAALENTDGRTEAEAEAFRAGAERLRARG